MDNMRIALSDLAVRKLKAPEQGQVKYRDLVLPGFGLIVGKRSRTFFVIAGEDRRHISLGRYPDLSLVNARREAAILLAEAPSKRRIDRLPQLTIAFLDDCESRLRPKSVRAYESILKHAPDIAIAKVDRTNVAVTTAHEIKTYKALFNWAIREEIFDKNPFLHLQARFGQRDRILTDEEICILWRHTSEPYGTIVKLLLLTGQRRSQIWRFDPTWLRNSIIYFPAEIMKSGRRHQLPVGALTQEFLPSYPFAFNAWSKSQVKLRTEVGSIDWTLHDLRRTFATHHASIGTPIHVIEALLDHSSGKISGVAAIYNRYNYLREMTEAQSHFEDHVLNILN